MGNISENYLTQNELDEFCDYIIDGKTTREAARIIYKDRVNVMKWLNSRATDAQRNQYALALEMSADSLVDDALEASDEKNADVWVDEDGKTHVDGEAIQRSRLKADTRKWAASKRYPKRYGEKIHQELTGKDGGPIKYDTPDEERAARLAALLDAARARRAGRDARDGAEMGAAGGAADSGA